MTHCYLLSLLLLSASFSAIFAQNISPEISYPVDGTAERCDPTRWPFYHGIASGDPLPDAVILWTRVTPTKGDDAVQVRWEIALDETFENPTANGMASATSERDFTVKVDARNLDAGRYYFYRFEAYGKKSPTGRTKTAKRANTGPPVLLASLVTSRGQSSVFPSPNEQVRLAIVSCNNFEAGFFNAFARMAELPDLDAVVHLGDYIYEYGPGRYGDTSLHRTHLPPHEIVTLQDYRTRYAQYRLDADLQEAHRMHPFICVWDDHEIANNAHAEGAQNHQPEEGSFDVRKLAATKAYYEWLPVRENGPLYRHFSFGGVADLFMLDERLDGREPPIKSKRPKKLMAERSMLGERQLDWLKNGLKKSNATWKVIGNQVLLAELNVLPAFPKVFLNFDAWDGYPAERQALLNFLANQDIQNVVFATGDTHNSWCFDIPLDFKKYKRKGHGKIVAREFATPSATSANFDELKGEKTVRWIEKSLSSSRVNPHLRYMDLRNHGYLLLTLTPYDVLAEWRFVEDIRRSSPGEFVGEKQILKAIPPMPLAAKSQTGAGAGK